MEKFDKQKFKADCSSKHYNEIMEYLQTREGAEEITEQYREIFEEGRYVIEAGDDRISDLLRRYEDYLKWVFTADHDTASCQAYLLAQLQPLFPTAKDWDTLEGLVAGFLKEKGYYAVFGITPPYPDLYLWKKQTMRPEEVELPDTAIVMNVYEMDEVITGGWYDYFSLHMAGAAGWVGEDGAYYFKSRYDIASDEFRVSLLKHEGQHFFDLKRYPDMKSTDLEYRAKLVELAYYTNPKRLYSFLRDMGDDRANPHPYANGKIARELSRRIFGLDIVTDPVLWEKEYDKVPVCAREMLKRHNERLRDWNGTDPII